ncbi:MAG: DUF1640 domain-containing protein [Gammaproteobacteria bacterium]|nr:DUF1640 domain-containing protein [Gammaproteobacteria bacterium]
MSEAAFDTHAEIRKLERAGCPKKQAEAMVDLVNRAPLNIEMVKAMERLSFQVETNMATKADIAELRAETKADIAELRAETTELRAERKADIKELRADMFRALWIQGGVLATLILGLAGLMLGLTTFLLAGA